MSDNIIKYVPSIHIISCPNGVLIFKYSINVPCSVHIIGLNFSRAS